MIVSTRSFYHWSYLRYSLPKELSYAFRRMWGPDTLLRDIGRQCQLQRKRDALAIFRPEKFLADNHFRPDATFAFANHHEAHALPSLFYTDWDDVLIFTADGIGDNVIFDSSGNRRSNVRSARCV
ncbi:MAG TPA: hypothetical protein VMG39_15500 [Pseudolabrys sp.]|nr:hypothetical protein [Pseudolabrys sp.]